MATIAPAFIVEEDATPGDRDVIAAMSSHAMEANGAAMAKYNGAPGIARGADPAGIKEGHGQVVAILSRLPRSVWLWERRAGKLRTSVKEACMPVLPRRLARNLAGLCLLLACLPARAEGPQFQVDATWQKPPAAKCCVAAPPVLVFDGSGNLLFSWGGPGPGYQWPESEHGIFVDADDHVWLAGNGKKDGQLLKFTMGGKFVLQVGRQGAGNDSNATDRLGSPADVAVDVVAREVYAADGYGNRRVVVFDAETGAYKRHWGAYGKRPSDDKTPPYDPAKPPSTQFGNPVHCIRISADGLVYVCDRTNDRLQVFRKDGSFVSEHVFERETRGTGSVYDMVFSPDREQRHIYLIDGMNGEVRIVDRASKRVLSSFGRPGRQAGEFTALHNIAVDRQGNIYTAEVNTGQRVQKFRRVDRQE
jgi:DNA-binding beta-propeller fold protein YncE